MIIPAGEFKAKCLKLMDEVSRSHQEIIITKRGKPVAKLVPVPDSGPPVVFGSLKGTAEVTGDIISPIDEQWDAH